MQLLRKMIVDPQIAREVAAGEFGEIDTIVQDRPQHAVGEAIVVFLEVLLGEIGDDVFDLVAHGLVRLDLGARHDSSAPAKPDSRHAFERRLDGDFEPAGAGSALVGNGDAIRYYDELRQ